MTKRVCLSHTYDILFTMSFPLCCSMMRKIRMLCSSQNGGFSLSELTSIPTKLTITYGVSLIASTGCHSKRNDYTTWEHYTLEYVGTTSCGVVKVSNFDIWTPPLTLSPLFISLRTDSRELSLVIIRELVA